MRHAIKSPERRAFDYQQEFHNTVLKGPAGEALIQQERKAGRSVKPRDLAEKIGELGAQRDYALLTGQQLTLPDGSHDPEAVRKMIGAVQSKYPDYQGVLSEAYDKSLQALIKGGDQLETITAARRLLEGSEPRTIDAQRAEARALAIQLREESYVHRQTHDDGWQGLRTLADQLIRKFGLEDLRLDWGEEERRRPAKEA